MRTIIKILFTIVIQSMVTSCSMMWDYAVLPFSKVNKPTEIKLEKFYPDCDYICFSIDTIYNKNILQSESFSINIWKIEHNSNQSPMQTIMFDANGDCVGAYEFCYGNAKYLGVYEYIPIFKENRYNSVILDRIKLVNYINITETDEVVKSNLEKTSNSFDYTIVAVWTDRYGYYMKRHLRQIMRYVNKNKDNKKFRVIYLQLKNQ